MRGVIIVHVRADMIIPAAHFDDAVDAARTSSPRARRRSRAASGRGACTKSCIVSATRPPCRRALHAEFLVGDAPDGHARMIAVAADQVVPNGSCGSRSLPSNRFSSITSMPRRSQASSNSGVGGLCEVPIGVAAHLLQLGDAEILQRIRHGRADARMVLVIAGAVELVRLAVQQKTLVHVKRHRADAEFRLHAINHGAARQHRRDRACRAAAIPATIKPGPASRTAWSTFSSYSERAATLAAFSVAATLLPSGPMTSH